VIFLLDANVLVDFQRSEILPALARAASVINLAVAEEVFGEVTEPTSRDSTDATGGGTAGHPRRYRRPPAPVPEATRAGTGGR